MKRSKVEKSFLTQERIRCLSRAEPKSRYITRYFKEATIVADIGCGAGIEANFMQSVCDFVIGVDVDLELLKMAKSHLHNENLDLIRADVTESPFRANVFDAIVMFDVLEHLNAPVKVLTKLSQTLRENGFLVLGVPNKYTFGELLQRLLHFLDETRGSKLLWNVHHVNFFDVQDIIQICSLVNLNVHEALIMGEPTSAFNSIFSIITSLFAHVLFLNKPLKAKRIENILNSKSKTRKRDVVKVRLSDKKLSKFFLHDYMLFTLTKGSE